MSALRSKPHRTMVPILLVAIAAATGAAIDPAGAEGPPLPVESHDLVEKMWSSSPSPAEMRAGIEAAMAIPEWQAASRAKLATQ